MQVDYRRVPIALWALAGILVLAAYLTSSVGLLVAAAVLAVGGSIVRSIDRLRDDLRAARIAAELGGTGAPPLETIASLALLTPVPPPTPAVPLARPYTRPPWEKDPQEAP